MFAEFSDLVRAYVSEDLIITTAAITGIPGFTFQLAFFFHSVLRISRAMRRDGIEPPSLHWLNIIGYLNLFAASRKSIEKMIKTERDAGITKHSYGLFCTEVVIPYIRPIDRFISRSFYFFGGIFLAAAFIYMWLYSD